MDKDTESKLYEFVAEVYDISNLNKLEVLDQVSLQMFDTVNANLCEAFYRCRFQVDMKSTISVPDKGSAKKVDEGIVDKKTKGPLLIKLCYDVRNCPTVCETPVMTVMETPRMDIKAPHVVEFEQTNSSSVYEYITEDWLKNVQDKILHIYKEDNMNQDNEIEHGLVHIQEYSKVCADNMLQRLHSFLHSRLPISRLDLQPRRHWIWDSLRSKLYKVCAIMIMSIHIVPLQYLKYRNTKECILSAVECFKSVNSLEEKGDIDGNM